MKQHPFGDSGNTFNFLKKIFKLRMKNSYILNAVREVRELGNYYGLRFPTSEMNREFTL